MHATTTPGRPAPRRPRRARRARRRDGCAAPRVLDRAQPPARAARAAARRRRHRQEPARRSSSPSAAKATGDALVLGGQCAPYGNANVWAPIAEAIRDACDCDEHPDVPDPRPRARVGRRGARRARAGRDRTHRRGSALHPRGLRPAGRRPGTRPRRRDARRSPSYLEGHARQRPVVLALSDLHWADDLVLDLVERLLERLRNLPFVLVGTARPGFEQRWTLAGGPSQLARDAPRPARRRGDREPRPRAVRRHPHRRRARASCSSAAAATRSSSRSSSRWCARSSTPTRRSRRRASACCPPRCTASSRPGSTRCRPRSARCSRTARSSARAGSSPTRSRSRPSTHPSGVLDALADRDLLIVEDDGFRFKSELVREVAYGTLTRAERARRHADLTDRLARRARAASRSVAHHLATAAELVADLGTRARHAARHPRPRDHRVDGRGANRSRRPRTGSRRAGCSTARSPSSTPTTCPGAGPRCSAAPVRATPHASSTTRTTTRCTVLDEATEAGDRHRWSRNALTRARTGRVRRRPLRRRRGDAVARRRRVARARRHLGCRRRAARARRHPPVPRRARRGRTARRRRRSRRSARPATSAARRGRCRTSRGSRSRRAGSPTRRPACTSRPSASREIGDWGGLGWALGLLAFARFNQGNLDEADSLASQILTEAHETGDRWAVGDDEGAARATSRCGAGTPSTRSSAATRRSRSSATSTTGGAR